MTRGSGHSLLLPFVHVLCGLVTIRGWWSRALALPFVNGDGHLSPFAGGADSHCWRHRGKGWWWRKEGESEEG